MATLLLNYQLCPGDRLQLCPAVRLHGHEEPWPVHPDLGGAEEPVSISQRIRRTLQDAVQVMGARDGGLDLHAAQGHVAALRPDAEALRERLLPAALLTRLEQLPTLQHIEFRCDPLLNEIAFEAMSLWGEFLCFRYGTGRQLWTAVRASLPPRPRGDAAYRGFSLVDPGGLLRQQGATGLQAEWNHFLSEWNAAAPAAGGEYHQRIDFDAARVSRAVTQAALVDALRHHDIVNFICHHHYEQADPAGSGFALDEATRFTAEDLVQTLAAGVQPPLLMLSLACESGVTRGWEDEWPRSSRVHGLVEAAIRSGIRHYISTGIKIPAEHSPRLMLAFYQSLAVGRTVGQALRDARRALRQQATPIPPAPPAPPSSP